MALLASGFWSCVSFAVASLTNANAFTAGNVFFRFIFIFSWMECSFTEILMPQNPVDRGRACGR